jgi:hypothetical protein
MGLATYLAAPWASCLVLVLIYYRLTVHFRFYTLHSSSLHQHDDHEETGWLR